MKKFFLIMGLISISGLSAANATGILLEPNRDQNKYQFIDKDSANAQCGALTEVSIVDTHDARRLLQVKQVQFGPCESQCVGCGKVSVGVITNETVDCGSVTYQAEVNSFDTEIGLEASSLKYSMTVPAPSKKKCNGAPEPTQLAVQGTQIFSLTAKPTENPETTSVKMESVNETKVLKNIVKPAMPTASILIPSSPVHF